MKLKVKVKFLHWSKGSYITNSGQNTTTKGKYMQKDKKRNPYRYAFTESFLGSAALD